jgi:hypothetical protein
LCYRQREKLFPSRSPHSALLFVCRRARDFFDLSPFTDSIHHRTHASKFAIMKVFSTSTEFDYSWEEVSTSNWRKYGPWNEKTPHVIAVDTLSRTVDPETGIVSAHPKSTTGDLTDTKSFVSCERSASSHAGNQRRNGSTRCSVAKTPRTSTKHPTSTRRRRKSQCAR